MKTYLKLPINNDSEAKDVLITSLSGAYYGFNAKIDATNVKYYVYIDITYLGDIKSISLSENEYTIVDSKPKELYHETLRPKIHYSVSTGWNNDPNGMVYYNGIYHMFYQHNPAGNTWGNMCWGHAISKDMIHYQEQDIALYPDNLGAMYSGSAIVDYDNVTGFKENEYDPIILFYTAASSRFSQCVAYSTDNGKTFRKYDRNPIIPYISFWNRDPKVIKCEELDCYILALFLQDDNNNYMLFKSNNLLDWEPLQKIAIKDDYECPDIYKIKVEETNDYVYVLQGACGNYLIGKIEDGKFVFSETPQRCLYGNYIDYCGQSFSNIKDRIIQVYWQKSIIYDNMPWGSNLSLPQEITMHQDDKGHLELYTYIAKEFDNLEKEIYQGVKPQYDCGYDIDADIQIDNDSIVRCFGIEVPFPDKYNTGKINVRIIVDTIGLTIYINKGIRYTSIAKLPDYDKPAIEIEKGKIINKKIFIIKSFYD